MVNSQCSRVECFHFTHTLCIRGFYCFSRQMSLFLRPNWGQVLINGVIGMWEFGFLEALSHSPMNTLPVH
jgi:hypothetical protein